MIRNPLEFKNAFALFHRTWFDDAKETQEFLRLQGVRRVFLLATVEKPGSPEYTQLNSLRDVLESHGFAVAFATVESVLARPESHKRFLSVLNSSLHKEATALLYSPAAQQDSIYILSTLLLGAGLSPARALQRIVGEYPDQVLLRRLEVYAAEKNKRKAGNTSQPEERPRFTIRTKLLLMAAGVVVTSLTIVTMLGTFFFKKTSETMIQEYNLSLARLIGLQVQSDLQNIVYRSDDVLAGRGEADFFKQNASVVLVRSGARTVINPEISEDRTAAREDLIAASSRNGPDVERAVVRGSEFLILRSPSKSTTIVLFASRLLDAFRTTRQTNLFQLYLVDRQGNFLLSTAEFPTTSGREVPIVLQMISSPVDNGSRRYEFQGKEYLGSFQTLNFSGLGIVSFVEADRVFEAVYRIQKQNFKITLIVLAIAFLGVFYFSSTLTGPIVRLVSAMRRVQKGDYHTDIVPKTADEVGILTSSFLSMTRGLEEREKIKDAFGRFVHEEVANMAMHGELKLGGEQRRVAIFFSDLRNFTGIAEKMQPEQVVDMLNQYFSAMVECVYETGGVVDKYIGDAIMAHWGAFRPGSNDTKNAVEAAIRMRESLVRLNQEFARRGQPVLRCGCGINTGDVIAGQIGSRKRLEYTVIGDAVNFASRIEYLNKAFGTDILISHDSMREVEGMFHAVQLPTVKIRGKDEPQIVFAILGRAGDESAPQTLDELRMRLGIQFDAEAARKELHAPSDQ
ncbi:MAG TPA: adenylate/guanylate cyclase domain-containing protein, partial [Leptospiraceae bacterium]|nr:adenylate/guanylate cyclase domain-containing protein [Leptospiraceae bacterium]